MNKLKTGKGALKDYHRCLADEYDDYAEEPEESDPIVHISQSNTYQKEIALQKPKTQKIAMKQTSRWPKYQQDFNFTVASAGIFERLVGEKLAMYLKISDVAKLLRTCQYLNKIFSKTSIWSYYLTKSYGNLEIPNKTLSSINIIQYCKYLRFAINYDFAFRASEQFGMRNDGIVFDTGVIRKNMKNKEEEYLPRNIVDSVTVKSQKTIDSLNRLPLQGSLTGDVKISWMKEKNQICVWMAGYQVQNKNIHTLAGILFKKKYNDLVNKVYFLNDRYFVVETEEKGESFAKTFEVFVVEAEDDWFERKEAALCKQVFKQTFAEDKVMLKMIGDFFVFVSEKEENVICIQVFDIKGSSCKSEDLKINAELYEIIPSKCGCGDKLDCFILYLIDQESNIYVLSYSRGSDVTLKKIGGPKVANELRQENQRFSDPVKRYAYGTFKTENRRIEYLMVYKDKQFYLTNFETNELVLCNLPKYPTNSKFYNWTICENYLYLLFDRSIQIFKLDFLNYSAFAYKNEEVTEAKFKGSAARWIFVNPCFTVIMSAGSFDEGFVRSLQLWIGSTQRLLMNVDGPFDSKLEREKAKALSKEWRFDECRLDKIFEDLEDMDLTLTEKERLECKFEDERLLIQTNFTSYFRDFNVGEKKAEKKEYEWKSNAIYNLEGDTNTALNSQLNQNLTKGNDISFVKSLLNHENRHQKKKQTHNWKAIEKKPETEEKLEKKESRKKGEKYEKNIRQDKHSQKMFE